MAPSRAPSAQLLRSLRALELRPSIRALSTSCRLSEQVQQEAYYKNPQPDTVFDPQLERRLIKAGQYPIGSRRRRMALSQSPGVPFDQLPYQCFQEARAVLIADRQEKLQKIELMRKRIARVSEKAPKDAREEGFKQRQLGSMRDELEHLKILADSNDPNIKRRFEDGLGLSHIWLRYNADFPGDMAKPIYRFLANRKWREYKRKILVQRITQLKVVPDVIPNCDPELDMSISFNRKRVSPGDFVDSAVSQNPCQLSIQSFDRGSKLVTIAVIDPDVPNMKTNNFDARCHFLATNVEITPTTPDVNLASLSEGQVAIPWLPPTAQKGTSYHRLSIVVLEQKDKINVDREKLLKYQRNFSIRALMTKNLLKPISATLFRTKWDENMPSVMEKLGMKEEATLELKRDKVEPLPYKRRNPSTFR